MLTGMCPDCLGAGGWYATAHEQEEGILSVCCLCGGTGKEPDPPFEVKHFTDEELGITIPGGVVDEE